MSEEEKARIREQHKAASKEFFDRKASEKGGLKPPEKPKKRRTKRKAEN